jgi:hypothetical protein
MVAITHGQTRQIQPLTMVLRLAVVALTLATAVIHARLGGLLFLANAIGYTVLTLAMVVPGPLGRVRWLVRLALIGFTAATVVGWFLFGARFDLAYLDKAIEVALIGVLGLELWLIDGGPVAVVRRARRIVGVAFARLAS